MTPGHKYKSKKLKAKWSLEVETEIEKNYRAIWGEPSTSADFIREEIDKDIIRTLLQDRTQQLELFDEHWR